MLSLFLGFIFLVYETNGIGECSATESNFTAQIGIIYSDGLHLATAKAIVGLAENQLRLDNVLPDWILFNASVVAGCEDGTGIAAAVELYINNSVDCIIGPACSSAIVGVAGLSAYWNIPIIDFATTGAAIDDDSRFPTLARVSFSQDNTVKALLYVLNHFNWSTIGIIADPVCKSFATSFYSSTLNSSIAVQMYFITDLDSNLATISSMKTVARIFVLCIGSDPVMARPVILSLINNNMTTPDYMYIIPSFSWQSVAGKQSQAAWVSDPPDGRDLEVQAVYYRSVFVIEQQFGQSTFSLASLQAKVRNYARTHNYPISTAEGVGTSTPYLYDAVYLYGIALNRIAKSDLRRSIRNGTLLFENMENASFQGMSGLVTTDWSANRLALLSIFSYCPFGSANCTNADGKNYSALMNLVIVPSNKYSATPVIKEVDLLRDPVFLTANGQPPANTPICGFDDDLCHNIVETNLKTIILSTVMAVGVVMFAAVSFLFYWKRRKEHWRQLKHSWQIDLSELHLMATPPQLFTRRSSFGTPSHGSQNLSQFSVDEESQRQKLSSTMVKKRKIVFGTYRNQGVVVKKLPAFVTKVHAFSAPLSNPQLQEIKTVKEVRHENLNTFLGLALDHENQHHMKATILWTHCSRGSLEDLLFQISNSFFNEDLDNSFKASISYDITKGLECLHKASIIHGALTPSNCLVDSRWIVKITDYGPRQLVGYGCEKYLDYVKYWQMHGPRENEDTEILQGLFHAAPEALKSYFKGAAPKFSKEADIFSLGMLLREIQLRRRPHEELNGFTAYDYLKSIVEPMTTTLRLPSVRLDSDFSSMQALTEECANPNARLRPTVTNIRRTMEQKVNVNINLVDHMLAKMENYATNLEQIIEERTGQLYQERQKADALLKEMLPPSVAEELKAGRHVIPETFECVTLYFSDIVGFTVISSESTPVEVVAMLNLLYTGFDEIIKQHDAYKVETVGDAYMVVSGLPKRNGMKHVTEIANLTLAIRQFVANSFRIPHIPERSMEIRIGCHLGSVAAGVIGITMPKFCLFGDTVNMASRMESSGQPMKIHLSEAMYEKLDTFGGSYQMSERGIINVKGKGPTRTYWLDGKVDKECNQGKIIAETEME